MRDAGFRRYLPFSLDFDTRAETLALVPSEAWPKESRRRHEEAQIKFKEGLLYEYGISHSNQKIDNFIEIGRLPFSIISFHNLFHRQARDAFICGNYYPALTSVCALGERILNHLILDLREHFVSKASFKKVASKKSFDNWDVAINTLVDWGILVDDTAEAFRMLKILRNSAIHFKVETYDTCRTDALRAFECMRTIAGRQFGSFGNQPWMISGTSGHCFIKKEFESNPFVKTYYLPQCPLVGMRFAMRLQHQPPTYFDIADYGDGSYTDEQFKDRFNSRGFDEIVNPDVGKWKPLVAAKIFVPHEAELSS